jgi:hypothetical protein
MNFVKSLLFIFFICSVLFTNIKVVGATSDLYLKSGRILDDHSFLSIDINNRQLIYPDGVVSALDWSTAGKILINGASSTDTAVLQVSGSPDRDFANFYNDSNYFTIKSTGQIENNTPIGTKPFDILSTTLVNNLNADLLDGYQASSLELADNIVKYIGGLTLPTIVGQSGKVLTNNGSALSWGTALTAEADTLATVTARGAITDTPLTFGQLTIANSYNLIFGTTNGTKIGTEPTQKLAFFNATPILQPINTVPLDTVLVNLGLQASGGNPSVSTNFKIGSGEPGVDYTLTFDGYYRDGIITWMEDEDQFKFNDKLQTDGGRVGKITTVIDTYTVLVSDETIVGNKATDFTINLPTAVVGQIFTINNIGVGVITVDGAGGDIIDGVTTKTLNQFEKIKIQCISANTWVII